MLNKVLNSKDIEFKNNTIIKHLYKLRVQDIHFVLDKLYTI